MSVGVALLWGVTVTEPTPKPVRGQTTCRTPAKRDIFGVCRLASTDLGASLSLTLWISQPPALLGVTWLRERGP